MIKPEDLVRLAEDVDNLKAEALFGENSEGVDDVLDPEGAQHFLQALSYLELAKCSLTIASLHVREEAKK